MSETKTNVRPSGREKRGRRRSTPDRIDPLAVLPIFMKLHGRRVIVTGGDAPSAWKAELASAAGAHVTVYAEAMSDEMEALAVRPVGNGFGPVKLVRRPWSLPDLAKAALLIGDAATEGEAWALRCAGQATGMPVNVIDMPEWCDFQFSTIVNRSPVVIAISTDGAAPIVGQAIRQRIEAVLGPALGAWAKLAQRIRPLVNERLEMGPERRTFWQRFSQRVFGAPPREDEEADLSNEIDAIAFEKPGEKILLVGVGRVVDVETSGLTLGALAALQSADRILHSAAVPSAILELGRREAGRSVISAGSIEGFVSDVAGWIAEGETVSLVLPGDPAAQLPELADGLKKLARSLSVIFEVAPAIADPSFGYGDTYLSALAISQDTSMTDENAIPTFTDAFQYRLVGDTGLLVLIDGEEAFNARGIPEAFLLKVDGQTSMGTIMEALDKELAEPSETIRKSVSELVDQLETRGAIIVR
ncbi:bifunctional precorrin-2 dehydrogenase/sirohydrochlorin ferrochelatase [Notoacmeibacter sp. MSK16QG-6]|uniref:precorrin-2 dehydrogenase/sirohydrochlorin ferrochelatase family protein n=1 Tax=Notoacmeibacter sp. MSK16QG-6 TaxID=2957982 RepID=UPI00209D0924|nr:NAD(P)-dependent oxidoreductase [Notoacmeibacter sp. MSK16QG-6]MCP1200424.1 uroporphyrinogen-III C-methyltransferase [Notoacmeibacter sp. MSK16QG-6]